MNFALFFLVAGSTYYHFVHPKSEEEFDPFSELESGYEFVSHEKVSEFLLKITGFGKKVMGCHKAQIAVIGGSFFLGYYSMYCSIVGIIALFLIGKVVIKNQKKKGVDLIGNAKSAAGTFTP